MFSYSPCVHAVYIVRCSIDITYVEYNTYGCSKYNIIIVLVATPEQMESFNSFQNLI